MNRYLASLRNFAPRRARRVIRSILEWGHAELLMRSQPYRVAFILREMEAFRRRQGVDHTWLGTERLRIGALWDNDGRFKWLTRVARERNIGFLHIPRSIYRPVFAHLIQRNGYRPNEALGEISLDAYYAPHLHKYRQIYLRYCQQVAAVLGQDYGFDAFLLPKLNDDWIIDVIRGFRQKGYPVVVQDREHGITQKRLEMYPKHLAAVIDDLIVERLCVSNETHWQFFELCDFPPQRLALTGKPDSDYWKLAGPPPRRQEICPSLRDDRLLMIFFAFGRLNYLNFFYIGETRDWLPLSEDYHEVLLELIRQHGTRLQIVYKIGGKPARDNYPGFEAFIAEAQRIAGKDAVIVLDGNYSTLDLLRVSDLVIGFHTLGLVESMFTNQPIFYGGWGPLFQDIKETLIPLHHSSGLSFHESKTSLLSACDQFIQNPASWVLTEDMSRGRKITREQMFYKPDGKTSERLMDVIEEVITLSPPKHGVVSNEKKGHGTCV